MHKHGSLERAPTLRTSLRIGRMLGQTMATPDLDSKAWPCASAGRRRTGNAREGAIDGHGLLGNATVWQRPRPHTSKCGCHATPPPHPQRHHRDSRLEATRAGTTTRRTMHTTRRPSLLELLAWPTLRPLSTLTPDAAKGAHINDQRDPQAPDITTRANEDTSACGRGNKMDSQRFAQVSPTVSEASLAYSGAPPQIDCEPYEWRESR